MCERAYLACRVQEAGPCLVEGHVYVAYVGIIPQSLLDDVQVGEGVDGLPQLDIRHAVCIEHITCTLAVRPVVYDQGALVVVEQGVQHHVHADGSGPAKQDGGVLIRVTMDNTHQVAAQGGHDRSEFFFTRADVRYDLGVLDGIGGGGRSRIEENISPYGI